LDIYLACILGGWLAGASKRLVSLRESEREREGGREREGERGREREGGRESKGREISANSNVVVADLQAGY
jgi:hypothetical protein